MDKIGSIVGNVSTITQSLDQQSLKLANLIEDKLNIVMNTASGIAPTPETEQRMEMIEMQITNHQHIVVPMICDLLVALQMWEEYSVIRQAFVQHELAKICSKGVRP